MNNMYTTAARKLLSGVCAVNINWDQSTQGGGMDVNVALVQNSHGSEGAYARPAAPQIINTWFCFVSKPLT